MPIKVSCGACGGKFNAPDSASGRQARWPSCKAPITIGEAVAAGSDGASGSNANAAVGDSTRRHPAEAAQ
jgi:hypothetical protein